MSAKKVCPYTPDAMLERMQQEANALALKARNDARAQLGLSPELEVSR